MPLARESKISTIETYRVHAKDTGSSEVQVALLSGRINYLTEHFRTHKKDFAGRRGLMALVNQRRTLLAYLKSQDEARHQKITEALNIRR